MLSLIASMAAPKCELCNEICDSRKNGRAKGPTLVICPASVIQEWKGQIEKFTKLTTHSFDDKPPEVVVYHGQERKKSTATLQGVLLILTSYSLVQNEFHKKPDKAIANDGLFSVRYERVILDEGHTIKNSKSKTAEAIYMLESGRLHILF